MGGSSRVIVETRHHHTVLGGLNSLRLNKELCDVVLCCGGQEFSCHRAVLASFSSYFQAMFTSGMLESRQDRVDLHGVEAHIIDLLLTYAYTSKVVVTKGHLQDLAAAANMLDFKAVAEQCCGYLENQLTKDNCVEIHGFAETHSLKMLEQRSMACILEHFTDIRQQEEFLSLPVETVTKILSNEDLNVAKEETVFEAAMLWINKCPTHRQHFEKVLECIRLPLISPSYLHDVVESLEVVKESPCCQRLISEAKGRHHLPYSKTLHPRRTTEVLLMVGEKGHMASFDPLTKEWKVPLTTPWKSLPSLPSNARNPSLAVSGSFLYVAGGVKEHPDGFRASEELWRIDPSHDDSWIKMAPMNEARNDFGLVALDGYLWAVGGVSEEECLVERFDPDNTWQVMKSVDRTGCSSFYSFYYSTVVSLDGLIYAIDNTRILVYDTETSEWTEVAPTPFSVSRPASVAACTLNGKIYAIGSDDRGEFRMQCYNPKNSDWTTCASLNIKRHKTSLAVVDGKIYVLGGWDMNRRDSSTIELYCEDMDTWESVGKLPDGFVLYKCVSFWLSKHLYDIPTYSHPWELYNKGI